MLSLLVNLIGIGLIGIIVWWFLIDKPKAYQVEKDIVDILVKDGIYQPSNIRIPAKQKVNLRFTRLDESPCSEYVVFERLDLSVQLPLGKTQTLVLQVDQPGKYDFSCQMGMYRGQLLVK